MAGVAFDRVSKVYADGTTAVNELELEIEDGEFMVLVGPSGCGKTTGIQKTAAGGLALFKTVYPGWYQGRTVHIHVMVHVGGNVVHTGQLYFPDTLTDTVYTKAPYSSRPARSTRNANDSVYRNGGSKSLVTVHADGAGGYVASIVMGVHR